jgi:hypothetical protein
LRISAGEKPAVEQLLRQLRLARLALQLLHEGQRAEALFDQAAHERSSLIISIWSRRAAARSAPARARPAAVSGSMRRRWRHGGAGHVMNHRHGTSSRGTGHFARRPPASRTAAAAWRRARGHDGRHHLAAADARSGIRPMRRRPGCAHRGA